MTNAKQILDLKDCRLIQTEKEHIKKWNGSMYATDIACVKWKSFEVKSPIFYQTYIVDKIGYDRRLWNYIRLKSGDYKFVYAHTTATTNKTKLKEWDKINSNKVIGSTDVSWISENYHLHFEVWKWDKNISFNEMIKWKEITNEVSDKLISQRGWWQIQPIKYIKNDKEILKHLADWEGLRLSSYKDWPTRYSIWYGTKSYRWEVITKNEADNRWMKVIWKIVTNYNLNRLDINKQKALVSFVYNVWSLNKKQKTLLKQNYYCALWNDLLNYKHSNWKVLWWLVKRRTSERNLLCE